MILLLIKNKKHLPEMKQQIYADEKTWGINHEELFPEFLRETIGMEEPETMEVG